MLNLVFIFFLLLIAITVLYFILTKSRQQTTQRYSISTFLGTSFDNEIKEPKESLIGKINNYFEESIDGANDGDENSGGGDDTSE